jgi:hypothetical protein
MQKTHPHRISQGVWDLHKQRPQQAWIWPGAQACGSFESEYAVNCLHWMFSWLSG